jgi:hypothetical protein
MEEQSSTEAARPLSACGVFAERQMAEDGINRLINAGFGHNQISVAMRGREEAVELAQETDIEEGEAVGASIGLGAVIGAAAGILAGLGLLVIPGIGPLLAAGPIVAGITGAIAGGGIGALAEGLIHSGIHETEARAIEDLVREGGVLITVECGDRCSEATEILQDSGAGQIACSSEV